MTMTQQELDKKLDNLQGQIDMIQRGDMAFKGHVNRQFDIIIRDMATREDLRDTETRLVRETNQALGKTNRTIEELGEKVGRIGEKVGRMDGTLAKIAEKLGV